MNLYEIMYIIKPDIEGEDLEEAIARVKEVLEKEGSVIEQVKKMGKRRLAYEINDIKDGYYVLLNVRAEPGIVPALEHFFKVSEGYLRYMVIRLDDQKHKAADEELQEEAKEEVIEGAAEEVKEEAKEEVIEEAVEEVKEEAVEETEENK